MIGKITGTLIEKQVPVLLINVSGIGYEVHASMNTFAKLPTVGAEVSLDTHLIVREDAHVLYGFYERRERTLFRSLIKVNGVGPKLAMTILSSIEPDAFVHCIHKNDSAQLVKLPGVGKKTAERLIIEMRDKLNDWHADFSETVSSDKILSQIFHSDVRLQEATGALMNLGYKPQEADRMIKKVDTGSETSETLIRLALKGVMA